ncbi:DUF2946 family protein [Benzoatithermus flavus]|uniref:DUF2946 family protein n=1 Tax=Benzoatithermus flavus TaxID=3108223 RepID=A0ABU8XNF4_9PROT
MLATLLALLALLMPVSHCWLPMDAAAPGVAAYGGHDHAAAGGHRRHDAPPAAPFDRLKCPLCQGRIGIAILPASPAALAAPTGYILVRHAAKPALPGLRPLLRPSLPRAPPLPA